MPIKKKQLKITKLFKKTATKPSYNEDVDDLLEEVKELEQKMKEKQKELFQIKINSLRRKASPPKPKEDAFIRPQKIILGNSIDSLKKNLELVTMLTSTEVQSYEAGEHCCVVFHMQHNTDYALSHGLKIEMDSGSNKVAASSLPLGFNLCAVMDNFDNVMNHECLSAIRKALVAYYDRLEQFHYLKKLLNIEAELFKTLDGSFIKISMYVKSEQDIDHDQFPVTLALQYRVYDIRPKTFELEESDYPEGADEAILQQCAVFKKKPLHKAFKEAFLNGIGQYKMVLQLGRHEHRERTVPRRRHHKQKHQNNDDTFQPEDCSDQGDDDEYYVD